MKHSMNIDVLKRAVSSILASPEQHDQSRFVHQCNTPACAAGHICNNELPAAEFVELCELQRANQDGQWIIAQKAQQLAGLAGWQAQMLFYGGRSASAGKTAAVIKNLIATGKVDWCIELVEDLPKRAEPVKPFNLAEYSERFIDELRNLQPLTDKRILTPRDRRRIMRDLWSRGEQ